ncbi:predicted protein [Nematostella vectensis]|uniref:F5/8 type C domain-containing protein n=1 Tax=Nematostella vectensis TaxID=45351 RepID=A7SSY1_NEMVE|nr:predicted protein [Nematostella vectensis]|eukprot:XP_001625288.1 predicted protein [Nematostella vectensis]
MENLKILDSAIKSHSGDGPYYYNFYARLHIKQRSWRAALVVNQFLQVDLGPQTKRVTGIATSGRRNAWVRLYTLSYSLKEAYWVDYYENGKPKIFQADKGGSVWIFPYNETDPKGPLRTVTSTIKHAAEALQHSISGKAKTIKGVKGFSWLSVLKYHDIIRGTAIDYMHGVLLGVQKLLLRLWFDSSNSRKIFSLSKYVNVIDSRLQLITPTLELKRLPRSISEHLNHWKANELHSFLLYYGLPVLFGLLPENYFQHYFCFVRANFLLLQESISPNDLKTAEELLQSFCSNFSRLYEERYMTLNLHQILHLVDNVRDLGPLYTHSCFSFEDKNGFILKLIHGTQFIDSQILAAVLFTQKLPVLREKCLAPGSDKDTLYWKLMHPNKTQRREEILKHTYVLGAFYRKQLNEHELLALENYLKQTPTFMNVIAFNRIERKSAFIYGFDYKRMSRRNCSTVKYSTRNSIAFAQVKCFIKVNVGAARNVHYLAIATPLECPCYNPSSTHITSVKRAMDKLVVFNISDICDTACLSRLSHKILLRPRSVMCASFRTKSR